MCVSLETTDSTDFDYTHFVELAMCQGKKNPRTLEGNERSSMLTCFNELYNLNIKYMHFINRL